KASRARACSTVRVVSALAVGSCVVAIIGSVLWAVDLHWTLPVSLRPTTQTAGRVDHAPGRLHRLRHGVRHGDAGLLPVHNSPLHSPAKSPPVSPQWVLFLELLSWYVVFGWRLFRGSSPTSSPPAAAPF